MAKKDNNGKAPDDKGKQQSLDLALAQIEKQYGKGSIMRMGAEGGIVEAEAMPRAAQPRRQRGRPQLVRHPHGCAEPQLSPSISPPRERATCNRRLESIAVWRPARAPPKLEGSHEWRLVPVIQRQISLRIPLANTGGAG